MLERDCSKPDPSKVFRVIADILADRDGIKVTLKSVKKKDVQVTA
ncbi:MAG: hypothetical protein K0S76_1869 [Herbinix sp.]|jgi:hypothetical protein|nr:hypothetical protein [Herbinix sp.]